MNRPSEGRLRRELGSLEPTPAVSARIVDGALARLADSPAQRRSLAGGARRWILVSAAPAAVAALCWIWLVQRGGDRRASAPARASAVAARREPAPMTDATAPAAARQVQTRDATRRIPVGPHVIDLQAHSALSIQPRGAQRTDQVICLEQGGASFSVAPLPQGAHFRVDDPLVTVEVIGTRFSVSEQDGCTWVRVTAGIVQVAPKPGVVGFARAGLAQGEPGARWLLAGQSSRFCPLAVASAERRAAASRLASERNGMASIDQDHRAEVLVQRALQLIVQDKEPDAAVGLLEEYLIKEPNGEFAQDALFHLMLAEDRRGHCALARGYGEQYVQRFPGTPRTARVRRWLRARPCRD